MRVVIGRIGRAHGIRGEVSIEIRTDEPEQRFAPGSSVFHARGTYRIVTSRPHSGRMLVTLEGINDRTQAELLKGTLLEAEVDPADLPDDLDEFYDHQLVGLEVRRGDEVVGTVASVLHMPTQDLLAVTVAGREVFVPFVSALVPEVDVAAGYVTVADLPGLLDPDQADVAGG
ncbi:ribosome maturation factor RimM [soil metagenome]